MAIVVKDRVKETTTTTGTGTITLAGAAPGFQAFSAIGDGNVTYYCIAEKTGVDWEVGYGTYSASGTTLTRNDPPLSSSNAGALVNFNAGIKEIFCTYPSEKAVYEETTGNVLIDGGPITVLGEDVTTYTTFSAALGEMYANVNNFAQFYAQNLNDGSSASTDIVAYNDEGDGSVNFIDMGISSSNYTDALYPIFTPSSGYVYNDGGELIIGSATDDVVLFAGGIDTTDEAVRIDKTTKNVTTVADVDVGGDLNATGGTFTAAVTTTASMVAPGATEFVTRSYVDEATSNGFHVHEPVLVATTGNLTATYNQPGGAGVGVGATLTNSGTQVALEIDGVSMATNDRVLVYQQTTGLQNGIYVVTTVGSGATNWVLTRSADANTSSEGDPGTLGGGDYFFVTSGTLQGFFAFICTNTSAIVFGTTDITFNEFSQVPIYTGTAPINVSGQTIALTGTVAATNGGTGTGTVATGDLLYGSGTNTWGKLAKGAAYKSLVMNSGATQVEWNAVALNQSGSVSGALPATNGGTGQSTYTLGDILYSSAANTLAKLAGDTTTTKKFLTQTGTGSVSAAPAWGTISGSDVSGNISGNAGSATVLATARNINGVSFNGSANISVNTVNALTLSNGGAGAVSGSTFNGGSAVTISYNSIGAPSTTGTNATGNWNINVTGSAASVAGTVAVANGGTGATDAATARTNLAVAGTAVSNTFSANQIVSVADNTNAALRITQTGSGNALVVEDSANPDSTPFVVNASGNVVIGGTTALATGLSLINSGSFTPVIASRNTTNDGGYSYLDYQKSRDGGIVQSGDGLGSIIFNGFDGTAFRQAALIRADVDGTPGTNDMPGRLVFSTTADGAASPTERARISSAGGFMVGTTTDPGTGLIADVAGNLRAIPPAGAAKTGSYTLAKADVGDYVEIASGGSITVPASVFAAGDAVAMFNNTTGNVTITCSAVTTYVGGTNTTRTSVTLATRGVCNVLFISSTLCVITGNVT
jgi:hypothetical protein